MRSPQDFPRRLPRTSRRFRIGLVVAIVVLVIIVASLRTVANFWTDYLWFKEVHFTSVFRGVLVNQVILALIFSVAFFLLLLLNLTVADRLAPLERPGPEDELVSRYRQLVGHRGVWVRVVISAIFGLIGGVGTRSEWNNWILLLHRTNFGTKDPINHLDIGFYVFELPFLRFLIGWIFAAVVVTIILSVLFHYLNGGINLQVPSDRVTRHVKTHISVLLAVLALIKAVEYYLERIEVVLNHKYIVDGATYTAVHAERPAFIVLIVAALFAVGLFLYNIREKGWMLPGVAVGVWIVVYLLVGVAYPAFIEAVRVNPSQLTRETPYLASNISATRTAMGLNTVAPAQPVQGNAELTASEVSGTLPQAVANEQALANVRLLDPSFIGTAFNKDQVLRGFYTFNSLDVDRYDINGQLTETLLSVRELNEAGVASGFVNQKLVYTHGNGAAVAPANQSGVNADGSVNYSLENLPPTGTPSLSGTGAQSDVYYGAGSPTGGYVIAGSKQAEFDYPGANGQQVSNVYKGSGGVPAGSLIRRAAFALRFGDLNFLLSGQITSSSRVMYYRNISQRVSKAAPFLKLDNDPYAVILNNQVYWIVDAYTVTNNYPDAQEASTARLSGGSSSLAAASFNYVRNSVKVVVNAYTGKMTFFVVDTTDPIIKAYERAFPDLFTNGNLADTLFPGITSHWRYPEDLFTVQTDMYGRYHLTSPSDFYSQALSWAVAQDPGKGTPGSGTLIGSTELGANGQVTTVQAPRFTPDYILTHLPGSELSQFLIFEPFVALSGGDTQQNLTGFMTGEFTPSGQATLQVFTTPPGAAVEGPLRAGSTIASTAVISQEITLLNTNGSTVKLGNLVPVLLNQTLLYVEPLYVESTSNPAAQLDDVIVVYNGQAYDSGNASLDAALCKITNSDGTVPFATYCNTAAAQRKSTLGTGTSTNNGTTSSTTSIATTTTVPNGAATTLPAAQGTTVAELLANAQLSLTRANAALASGNLAQYQLDVNQANADIKAAQSAEGSSTATGTTTTTTAAKEAPSTTKPASSTSSAASSSSTG